MINRLILLVRRAWLLFQMRALEVTIDGQSECLECISDPFLSNRILMAQINARKELRRVRAEYNAMRPVRRESWRFA